jgi:isocitrate dehydrogenase
MTETSSITVAYGDGIGPEIMEAALLVLREVGASLRIESIEVGQRIYNMGSVSGILPSSWESLRRTQLLLQAPAAIPNEEGKQTVEAKLRSKLELQVKVIAADVVLVLSSEEWRPVAVVDVVEETVDAEQTAAPIPPPALQADTEFLIGSAFAYAQRHQREQVVCVCAPDANEFREQFKAIAAAYPSLHTAYMTPEETCAQLAASPALLDVLVVEPAHAATLEQAVAALPEMAALAYFAPQFAWFGVAHGTLDALAGKNKANPSAMLLATLMMLEHTGQYAVAARIRSAWQRTLDDGMHTPDLFRKGVSKEKLGTREFAEAVVARLDKAPLRMQAT